MLVAKLISEIDDTLSRLRAARAILADSDEPARAGRRTSSPAPGKAPRSTNPGRGTGKQAKRRSVSQSRTRNTVDTAEPAPKRRPSSVAQIEPIPSNVVTVADPAATQTPPPPANKPALRARRMPTERRKPATRPESAKPSTPLGGSVPSGVVVVSAAEALRARDRAVNREPKRDQLVSTPRTGKAAFDALFADGGNPSRSSPTQASQADTPILNKPSW